MDGLKAFIDIVFGAARAYALESATIGYYAHYHRKNWKDVRPIPEKPIIDEKEYIARQNEIAIKYERDLEARIKSKIF